MTYTPASQAKQRSELYPVIAGAVADMAAPENCLVRKLLSQFDSGSHAADNRHWLVLDFSKVDLNAPAMYVLAE
jgi:hypothetical protein